MGTQVVSESDPRFQESSDEILVEVASDGIHPWRFPPIATDPLRCRWVLANMTATGRLPHESIAKVPDLPGMTIGVSLTTKTCRVFDPLVHTKEGRQKWEQTQAIMERAKQYVEKGQLEKQQRFLFNCSDTDLKTWLYWVRRGVDAGYLQVLRGQLPTMAEIMVMRGKTLVNQLNRMSHKPHYLEDDPDYQPPSPEELMAAGTGGAGGAGGSSSGPNAGGSPNSGGDGKPRGK